MQECFVSAEQRLQNEKTGPRWICEVLKEADNVDTSSSFPPRRHVKLHRPSTATTPRDATTTMAAAATTGQLNEAFRVENAAGTATATASDTVNGTDTDVTLPTDTPVHQNGGDLSAPNLPAPSQRPENRKEVAKRHGGATGHARESVVLTSFVSLSPSFGIGAVDLNSGGGDVTLDVSTTSSRKDVMFDNGADLTTKTTTKGTNKELDRKANREEEKQYVWLEKQFRALAGPSGTLDRPSFKKALQVKQSYFAERLFELFDEDHSGSVDLEELLRGLHQLTKGTPTEKLRFLFNIYDADNSGSISRDELSTVLRSCMVESSLHLSDYNLQALTDALFDDADVDGSGSITFDELQGQLEKHPGVMNNLTLSAAQWLMPRAKKTSQSRRSWLPRRLTLTYFLNNRAKVIFTLVYLLLNVGLYFLNSWLYRRANWYLIIARGAGMCLNFNCAFVLVLMLRKTLTFLRNTPLVKVLPFDQHVMFHKMAGYAVLVFACIHTAAHLGNAEVYLTATTNLTVAEILFTLKAGVGWIDGFAPLSGVLLDLLLLIMFVCSLEFVRRSGYFEVFYWTHKLYLPFFLLNILHGANFWKWVVGPGLLFCVEAVFRLQCTRTARYGAMFIETVNLLPSGVTELTICRPAGFRFKPGDYIFLNIPAIARYEWHPFTISSAPELAGVFTVHIRSAGHWTRKVYSHFEKYLADQSDPEMAHTPATDSWMKRRLSDAFSNRRRNSKAAKVKDSCKKRIRTVHVRVAVMVDGPYGTASRHIFEAEHAVLIGSGIGVTPFASILQSIVWRLRQAEVTCPSCHHHFLTHLPKSVMALKKVDFVWINRDQRNFEWFLSLLNRLELEQSRDSGLGHVLDMHMYMTSALTKNDMKGVGLQMALDLIHQNEKTDLVTGLQTRTQPGRPDFNKLFRQIREKTGGRLKVFFCGSPLVGRTVKEACLHHGFAFSQENF